MATCLSLSPERLVGFEYGQMHQDRAQLCSLAISLTYLRWHPIARRSDTTGLGNWVISGWQVEPSRYTATEIKELGRSPRRKRRKATWVKAAVAQADTCPIQTLQPHSQPANVPPSSYSAKDTERPQACMVPIRALLCASLFSFR